MTKRIIIHILLARSGVLGYFHTKLPPPLKLWRTGAKAAKALSDAFANLRAPCVLGVKIPFYLTDRLGSVRLLTSSTGAVTATYNYDAFGNSR